MKRCSISQLARITGAARDSIKRWRLLPDWPGDDAKPAVLRGYAQRRRREWRGPGATAGLRAEITVRQTLRIKGRTKTTCDRLARANRRLAQLLAEHPRRDLLAVVLAPLADTMTERAKFQVGLCSEGATFPDDYKPLLAALEAVQVRAAARIAATVPQRVHVACRDVVEGLCNE